MMDNLTNAMIRLSEEIAALRHNRAELKSDLALGKVNLESTISGMISGFRERPTADGGRKLGLKGTKQGPIWRA